MAWNKPNENNLALPQPKRPKHARSLRVGISVLAGVLLTALWFKLLKLNQVPRVEKSPVKVSVQTTRERMRQIVEAKTGKPLTTRKTAAPSAKSEDLGWYTNKLGEVKRRTGRKSSSPPLRMRHLFTNAAERQLDGIVNTPLGSNYYDTEVSEDFEETFAHSLTNRIVITEDDTPEEAEKKQRVIDAKEAIRQAWARGENICELVAKEKEFMQKKFENYTFFEQGLDDLRESNATAAEIAEYALAARKMMETQEIEAPLSLDTNEEEAYKRLEELINPKSEGAGETDVQSGEQPKENNSTSL